LHPIPAMRARLSIARGELNEAASWADASGIIPTDEVTHLREFELLTLVRLLIAQHRDRLDVDGAKRAVHLLERLRDSAGKSGRLRTVVETHVLTALALDAQGQRTEAVESLGNAWVVAPEPEAHVRLLLDEGLPMMELLGDAACSSVGSAHAQRLLDLAAPMRHDEILSAPRPEQARRPATMVDPLSDREMHVVRLLATDLSGPEIASELFVSVNTFRTHTKRIFTKLDVTTRRAAVSRARELGFL
jgi:LuxR family maltose regulon positive regulatory protein